MLQQIVIKDSVIERLSRASEMLVEAKSMQEVKKIMDVAAAAKIYAKRQQLGEKAVGYANSIKIEAMRRLGEIWAESPKNWGTRGQLNTGGSEMEPPATLSQLGIDKKVASISKQLAQMPKKEFEQVKEGVIGMAEALRQVKRKKLNKNIKELPKDKFTVIYADPPWAYNDKQGGSISEKYGSAEKHYPSMTLSELEALQISEITADNCVLWLWATSPLLEDALQLSKAWGFKYKAQFIWDKIKHNMGHYNSVRHELLLICTKGSCVPQISKLFDSVQSIERAEHSRKPDEFRHIIDTIYPEGNRVELFARRQAKGWKTWGNESR
jgi:N6-adenosine-specific RNA methylase IME4